VYLYRRYIFKVWKQTPSISDFFINASYGYGSLEALYLGSGSQ